MTNESNENNERSENSRNEGDNGSLDDNNDVDVEPSTSSSSSPSSSSSSSSSSLSLPYLGVDIVSILLATELLQLVSIVTSSDIGIWFQPIPVIPTTLSQFIIHFSTLCLVWILSSVLVGITTTSTRSNSDGTTDDDVSSKITNRNESSKSSSASTTSSSSSSSPSSLWWTTLLVFAILLLVGQVGIGILAHSGGGGFNFLIHNKMIVDDSHIDGSITDSIINVGRDVYFVGIFIYAFRFLYDQLYR